MPMYPCGKAAWCNNLNTTKELLGLKVSPDNVNYAASPYNVYNWWTKLEIACKPYPQKAVSYIATIALLGLGISCLFLPRLGDIYGRKPIYIFALMLQMAVYVLACIVTTLKGIYIVAAFLGPCVIGRMACGFLLLMELVPKKYQTWVGTALMVSEGASQIIWTIYFVTISKNAFFFVYFTVFLNFIAAVGAFYIVESPRYLFGMEKFDICRTVLNTIAKRNGV